jgi:hypothetical protein
LTYPILPPSAVIGMIANALQRFKNDKHPVKYLEQIENNVIWAGSRLLTSCIIKSYTTSAIVKWEDKLGGKFTNALGRQFSYSKNLQVLAIFKDESLVNKIREAVKSTPLTCGDSESPISLETELKITDAKFVDETKDIRTDFPIPFSKKMDMKGIGRLYLVHERCMKREDSFPLKSYLFPIRENKGILEPSQFIIDSFGDGFKVIDVDKVGQIVLEEKKEKLEEKAKRKTRKRK